MEKRSIVYVIGPKAGPFKIGITRDIGRRVVALQTGNPERLVVHFTRDVDELRATTIEANAHAALLAHRLAGEWFACAVGEAVAAVERASTERRPVIAFPPHVRRLSAADFRAIRQRRKQSAKAFATWVGLSTRTIEDWEQGRRTPPLYVSVFYTLIEREPAAVERALSAA